MKKILITTGGTGGHVIPAQIIQEHLKDSYEILYTTDKRGLKYLSSNNEKIIVIDTPKLNLNFYIPFKLVKIIFLIIQSIFYLKKENIKKVISIGGYMSLPIIVGAKILRLEIFLLEPNLVLGRGNRFFLNFSKKIICYSDKLTNFPKKYLHKIKLVNPLVLKTFYDIKKDENINKNFCFLISGGSQGAKIFDEMIKEAMYDLAKKH